MKSAPWRKRFRCSRTTRSIAFALSPCLRIRRCDKPAQARTEATEEIAQQISSVRASTEEAVNAIAEIVTSMTQVNEYTTSIAAGPSRAAKRIDRGDLPQCPRGRQGNQGSFRNNEQRHIIGRRNNPVCRSGSAGVCRRRHAGRQAAPGDRPVSGGGRIRLTQAALRRGRRRRNTNPPLKKRRASLLCRLRGNRRAMPLRHAGRR